MRLHQVVLVAQFAYTPCGIQMKLVIVRFSSVHYRLSVALVVNILLYYSNVAYLGGLSLIILPKSDSMVLASVDFKNTTMTKGYIFI